MIGNEDRGLDEVFDALANGHRRAIIHALSLQPQSISQLASMEELSFPAIHKHITALEEADLVDRRKVGRTNYLALRRKPLQDLQTWVAGFNPHWGDDRETLENYARYLGGDNERKHDQ